MKTAVVTAAHRKSPACNVPITTSAARAIAYHDSDSKNNGSGALNPADRTYLNEFRKNEGVDASYTKFHDQIDNNPYNRVHILNGGNMNLAYFDLKDAR